MPRIFWPILAAMFASWLTMNLWTNPRIEELAGGLRLLDMRFTGYSFAEAQAFIGAIGEEGRALYLGPQMWFDFIFPPLMAAVLFLTFRWLFPGWPGLVIGTASLSSFVVDWLENWSIAVMLRAGADAMTHEMAATASQWTTIKWSLAALGLATLIVGFGLRLRRRWAARAAGTRPRRRP